MTDIDDPHILIYIHIHIICTHTHIHPYIHIHPHPYTDYSVVLFSSLIAVGKKLLQNRADLLPRLRYRLPDGRRENKLWQGCVGSLAILFALERQRCLARFSTGGSVTPIVLSADLTTLLRALFSKALQLSCQREMLLVSTLSMVPL